MSSILRALKKLENDPRHLGETGPLDSKFVPLADTSPQKTSPRIIVLIMGGAIVCALVILAGWWIYAAKIQPQPAPGPIISTQNPKLTEAVPGKPKKLESPVISRDSNATAQPDPGNAIPLKTVEGLPESAPVKMKRSMPAANKQREYIKHIPAEEKAAAITTPGVQPEGAKTEIPELNDPAIKLQAITWSKNPQKRIVIINNSILRQGEPVNNYRIDSINQDDVVLSDGGEKWKVMFRIK